MACAVGAAPSNGTLRVIAGARTPPPAPTECTVTGPLVLALVPLTWQAHARHCSTARLVAALKLLAGIALSRPRLLLFFCSPPFCFVCAVLLWWRTRWAAGSSGTFNGTAGAAQTMSPVEMWDVSLRVPGVEFDLAVPDGAASTTTLPRQIAAVLGSVQFSHAMNPIPLDSQLPSLLSAAPSSRQPHALCCTHVQVTTVSCLCGVAAPSS